MRHIAILDTSILSFNLGDQIIMDSARKGLKPITNGNFVVNMPTHSPLFHWWEFSIRGTDSFTQNLKKIDLKFVCGTNLLEKNMRKRKNTWNIHYLDSKYFHDVILVGVGSDGLKHIANNYTKKLYGAILSKKYVHSTRDEATKKFLEELGFNAINTGCPTLWQLTNKHCENIPVEKSEDVVFTLTDYMPDSERDSRMIDILCHNYRNVWCWLQGSGDMEYFNSLKGSSDFRRIKFIDPSLQAYDEFLMNNLCDYIGTRLHAGIRAMQKGRRSIIVGVDNRAKDMHLTYKLNYIERNNIDRLTTLLNSKIKTNICLDETKIDAFLRQFV